MRSVQRACVHAYGRANECSPFIVVIEWVLTENKLKQNKMRIDARHTHTASCHGEWSLRNWRNTHTQSFQIAQKRLKSEPKYRISLIPYLHEKFKYLSIFCGGDGGSDAANATIDTYKCDRMTQFFSSLSHPKCVWIRVRQCFRLSPGPIGWNPITQFAFVDIETMARSLSVYKLCICARNF